MSNMPLPTLTLEDVLDILRHPPIGEDCSCAGCRELVAARGDVVCECGYVGLLAAAECACYDEAAWYCRPTSRGSGCFHGALTCPWCDGGERSGFEVLAAIRAAVFGEPDTKELVAAGKIAYRWGLEEASDDGCHHSGPELCDDCAPGRLATEVLDR